MTDLEIVEFCFNALGIPFDTRLHMGYCVEGYLRKMKVGDPNVGLAFVEDGRNYYSLRANKPVRDAIANALEGLKNEQLRKT